ncbi:MAG TPA: hypothetical protein VIC35_10615 [Acidimicrobiia bacterium]
MVLCGKRKLDAFLATATEHERACVEQWIAAAMADIEAAPRDLTREGPIVAIYLSHIPETYIAIWWSGNKTMAALAIAEITRFAT